MTYKGLFAAAVLVTAAASSTSAWAGWGCAYGSSDVVGVSGRRWAFATEQLARSSALNGCKSLKHKNCRIIGCSANVNSKEDADKLWAQTPGVEYNRCGTPGQPKC